MAGAGGEPLAGAAAQRRLIALLAILGVSGPSGVSRDRILGLLWAENEAERARGALAQALYHARRSLDCDDLVIGRDPLRLNRERMRVDAAELQEAIAAGALERAAELYAGPFLDGFFLNGAPEFERWAAEQRSRYEAQMVKAFERLAMDADARGDRRAAVDWRRRQAALHPLDSAAALQLMKALVAAGDRAGALQHARVHESLLRDQLDVAPDAVVTKFVAALRNDVAAPAAAVTQARPAGHGPGVLDRAQTSSAHRVPGIGDNAVEATDAPPAVPPPQNIVRDEDPAPRAGRGIIVRRIGLAALALAVAAVITTLVTDRFTRLAPIAAEAIGVAQPVVIAPFRVAGADPSLGYLHEGMVELLSTRLADDSSARSIDPGAVLGAWRAAGLTTPNEGSRAAALRVASGLGASRVVFGSIVGTPSRLVMTASLIGVDDGAVIASATVEGGSDSLSALVDRLAVELLAVEAGERERLARNTTPSLPALRAYLDGQAEYRRGDHSAAMAHYERALRNDSTFALAALRLAVSADRINDAEQHDRALALAWSERAELSEPDAAHLLAFAGPRYPAPSSELEQLAAWQQAVAHAPDRAEVWYELGERYFHYGAVLGLTDARARSSAALRRALALDPAHVPARRLLVLLAARLGDTTALAELATPAALRDSMGGQEPFVRWRVAIARIDQAELRRIRAAIPAMNRPNLRAIAMATQFDAVGMEDGERAIRVARLAPGPRAAEQLDALLAEHSLALNEGRPVLALDVTEQLQDAQPGWRAHLRLRILDAIYSEGDPEVAEEAAELLSVRVGRGTAASPTDEAVRLADACVVAQWRLARGELRGVAQIVAMLRSAGVPRVAVPIGANPLACAGIVDATMAVMTGKPDALQRVEQLDSLMLSGPAVGDASTYAHLAVARLYDRLGKPDRALAAIRRRPYMTGWPRYLATTRREEGLLAVRIGERERALMSFRQYLALTREPEARVRPLVASVRREVAKLEQER